MKTNTREEFYGRQYDEALANGVLINGTREEYIRTGLIDDAGGVVDLACMGSGCGGSLQNMQTVRSGLIPEGGFPEVSIR